MFALQRVRFLLIAHAIRRTIRVSLLSTALVSTYTPMPTAHLQNIMGQHAGPCQLPRASSRLA